MSSKRKDLTIKEKKDLPFRYDKLEKCFQREAALALKIPQLTLNKILKNRKEIVEYGKQNLPLFCKRKRNGQNVDVEESLLRWFQQARNLNVPVSNSILEKKAIKLALQLGVDNFRPTIGWMTRWKTDSTCDFKGSTVNGCKKQMKRLTILLACNMTGTDKKRPLIIGNSKNPRCILPNFYRNFTKMG